MRKLKRRPGRHFRGHDEAFGRHVRVQLYRTRQRAATLYLAMVHEVAPRRAKVARALNRMTVAVKVSAGGGGNAGVLAQVTVCRGVDPAPFILRLVTWLPLCLCRHA